MNIWQRTVYLSNTFLLWLSIDYEIGKCKQYWFAHLFYLHNYFTYCKIVSFLLFTGLTRFTHRFTYCVQCHIGCDNKLTVYIRLVSKFIFGPLVETVPLVILNVRGIMVMVCGLFYASERKRPWHVSGVLWSPSLLEKCNEDTMTCKWGVMVHGL